jgi:dTDP-L-rhamnose 4-epimerase
MIQVKAKNIENVLVTGGCGFIGSHTVDLLIEKGYNVVILDSLEPQVHGKTTKMPDYVDKRSTFLHGDIRDRQLLKNVIQDVDAIIHLAAMVGVGQSMYDIERYIDVNTKGSASLLDLVVNEKNNVKKLVVASSMSIYGEGKYYCERCGVNIYPKLRSEKALISQQWEHLCPNCKSPLIPKPTDEEKPLMPTSIYAMSKHHQEEMFLLIGKTYGIPAIALRYFNAYGSRQALSNPYTGCAAIFTSRILNNKPPYIIEDGNQTRDFIHVKDVARANVSALESANANYEAINIGTGEPVTIKGLAEKLIELYGKDFKPLVSREYRKGDIRHCYADVEKASKLLNLKTFTPMSEGLKELTGWAKANKWGTVESFYKAFKELKKRHLVS